MTCGRLGTLAAAALLAGAGCGSQGIDPPGEITYVARLNGDAVRPAPVGTTATGTGIVIIGNDNSIKFNITVSVLTDITMAHLHVGAADGVGAIVVDLLPTPPAAGVFSGNLSSGSIQSHNLLGGETMESLAAKIRSGNAYIDIHTAADPDGAIRGQITVL